MTEKEFLASYDSSRYKKPSLTADICIFGKEEDGFSVLMIRRKNHPFKGCFALPGGFAEEGEEIAESAARELFEETGLSGIPLKLAGIYSKPGRDPRGWVVSAAYAAVVDKSSAAPKAGDDAEDAKWIPVRNGILQNISDDQVAFDHKQIVKDAAKICSL